MAFFRKNRGLGSSGPRSVPQEADRVPTSPAEAPAPEPEAPSEVEASAAPPIPDAEPTPPAAASEVPQEVPEAAAETPEPEPEPTPPPEAPEVQEEDVEDAEATPEAEEPEPEPTPPPEAPEDQDADAEDTEVSPEAEGPEEIEEEARAPHKNKKMQGGGSSKKLVRELPRVLAVANQKGGVGKTTTTVNLGAALAEIGYRVLVIDLDPQGNATTGLGIERRNFEHSMYDVMMREQPLEDCIEPTSVKNLFVAPATLDLSGVDIELVAAFNRESRLKRAIEPIINDFDFILIDCPPSLGLITINALTAAREVLVPIQCEYYALEGLTQLRSTLQLVGANLNESLELSTIVLTMYDSRTNLSADVANDVREHFPDEVCATVIPRTVRLSEAPSFGQPITVFDPQSRGATSYRDLAKEVANGAPKRAG